MLKAILQSIPRINPPEGFFTFCRKIHVKKVASDKASAQRRFPKGGPLPFPWRVDSAVPPATLDSILLKTLLPADDAEEASAKPNILFISIADLRKSLEAHSFALRSID